MRNAIIVISRVLVFIVDGVVIYFLVEGIIMEAPYLDIMLRAIGFIAITTLLVGLIVLPSSRRR